MRDTQDKRLCRQCKYRVKIGGFGKTETGCYYIVHTGKPRGCPAGSGCIRFEKGNPPRGMV